MKTLLLIEDHPDMRENTMEILELAGYKVITAENGRAGIDAALKTIPDLIICDVMMPEMDGFELLDELAQSYTISDLAPMRIFMLTSSLDANDNRKSVENPFVSGFISKPLETEQLKEIFEKEKIV